MRRADGYATIIDPGASRLVRDFDIVSCIHCPHVDMTRGPNGNLEVMVFRADGSHYFKEAGFCRNCYHHICPRCVGKPCTNRFKRLDDDEAAARKLVCI